MDHSGLAIYLGRVAALNIMGKERDVHTVPFFWTVQFGLSLRNVGLGSGWDSVLPMKGMLQVVTVMAMVTV